MARFAFDCLTAMKTVVKQLETRLGPDTADLALRIGLHSGPVTAGVLRGEKSRFQLFGDTVNTTARMETTGAPGRVHISEATAKLLMGAGKEHWITSRDDAVFVKGKGTLKTYWVNISDISLPSGPSVKDNETINGYGEEESPNGVDLLAVEAEQAHAPKDADQINKEKVDRLICWSVETLENILVRIHLARANDSTDPRQSEDFEYMSHIPSRAPLREQKDSIKLLGDNDHAAANQGGEIKLQACISEQLKSFVTVLASLYPDNPFHNFEHACNVTMATVRLLRRTAKNQGDATYGLKLQNPLTDFALVFSALIHDADHQGVPNTQLIKEQTARAKAYGNKCIAEQTSIDVAWKLLMQDEFQDLRRAIYKTPQQLEQFRQIVVNCVIATDILDKDQVAFRAQRWADVFPNGNNSVVEENQNDKVTTILLEHLIQASDVSHTMQHWLVYRKWNEMLFMELYKAYSEGRFQSDPSSFWYDGEIGFFDNYIIPLAGKFAEGGAFELPGDQMLSYACQNREEWKEKGQDLVKMMAEHAKDIYGVPGRPSQHGRKSQVLEDGEEFLV